MGSCHNKSRYSNGDGREKKLIRDANTVETLEEKKRNSRIKTQETMKK